MQEVFNGVTITKKPIHKKDVPSGREWNDSEKETYYKNFRNNYSNWKNETIKLLYDSKILEYKNHVNNTLLLEEKMVAAFNNGINPFDFVKNYLK